MEGERGVTESWGSDERRRARGEWSGERPGDMPQTAGRELDVPARIAMHRVRPRRRREMRGRRERPASQTLRFVVCWSARRFTRILDADIGQDRGRVTRMSECEPAAHRDLDGQQQTTQAARPE